MYIIISYPNKSSIFCIVILRNISWDMLRVIYIDTQLVSICAYLSSAATSIYYWILLVSWYIYTYILSYSEYDHSFERPYNPVADETCNYMASPQSNLAASGKVPQLCSRGRTSLRFLHKKSPSEHHIPICSMYAISTNIYVIQKMTRNLLVNIQETWSTSDF